MNSIRIHTKKLWSGKVDGASLEVYTQVGGASAKIAGRTNLKRVVLLPLAVSSSVQSRENFVYSAWINREENTVVSILLLLECVIY